MSTAGANVPLLKKAESEKRVILHEQKDVTCDRCAMPMFRMRAVYWCESCGYKTDCCGH